ncbi:hypothetical protein GCM10017562_48660 [Streptomyces roseofulvus]|uniref:Uncharacterized protein n=2 Tax=Streptomyces TaxID=1883 RepID=A0ABU4KFR3_9ACTN|nr:hypothetical protein [Streptomyces roseolus]MDX2296177.1 hypothetical protein [Streptomyces roseolus]
MISEPELEGGAPYATVEVLTEERERTPRPPRGRAPWLWAVGGAVVASAVWGAGLYAHGLVRSEPGVDLGGYEEVDDLCVLAELKGMGAVLGERIADATNPDLDDPALQRRSCTVAFGEGEREQSVNITYTLHKLTDPGPEFAALAKGFDLMEPIGGVGEQAFFGDAGEDGGVLRVLDGQAVLELDVYRTHYETEDGEIVQRGAPDLSGVDVPLTQDALALMAALKK